MFRFCWLRTIFVSSLFVVGTASPHQHELEFMKKYPNSSTYTRWRELDNVDEIQLNLLCERGWGHFNPAAGFSVKVHHEKTVRYYAKFSDAYTMIRLDLLECEQMNYSSMQDESRTFFLAEGSEIGQIYKLVKGDEDYLYLIGIVDDITSDPFPPMPLQSSAAASSQLLPDPTRTQIGESYTQHSAAVQLNDHTLDEQHNLLTQYYHLLANAHQEPQPPDVPPLQPINSRPLQPVSPAQIEEPAHLTHSADLENLRNFLGLSHESETQQDHSNDADILVNISQEHFSPHIPVNSFQPLSSQPMLQPLSQNLTDSSTPEKYKNHRVLNQIASAMRNFSVEPRQHNFVDSHHVPVLTDVIQDSSLLVPLPPTLSPISVPPWQTMDFVTNEVEINHQPLNQNLLSPQLNVTIADSPSSSTPSLAQSHKSYTREGAGDAEFIHLERDRSVLEGLAKKLLSRKRKLALSDRDTVIDSDPSNEPFLPDIIQDSSLLVPLPPTLSSVSVPTSRTMDFVTNEVEINHQPLNQNLLSSQLNVTIAESPSSSTPSLAQSHKSYTREGAGDAEFIHLERDRSVLEGLAKKLLSRKRKLALSDRDVIDSVPSNEPFLPDVIQDSSRLVPLPPTLSSVSVPTSRTMDSVTKEVETNPSSSEPSLARHTEKKAKRNRSTDGLRRMLSLRMKQNLASHDHNVIDSLRGIPIFDTSSMQSKGRQHETHSSRDAVELNHPEHDKSTSAFQGMSTARKSASSDRDVTDSVQSMEVESSSKQSKGKHEKSSSRDAVELNHPEHDRSTSAFQYVSEDAQRSAVSDHATNAHSTSPSQFEKGSPLKLASQVQTNKKPKVRRSARLADAQQPAVSDHETNSHSSSSSDEFEQGSSMQSSASKEKTRKPKVRRSTRKTTQPAYLQEFVR